MQLVLVVAAHGAHDAQPHALADHDVGFVDLVAAAGAQPAQPQAPAVSVKFHQQLQLLQSQVHPCAQAQWPTSAVPQQLLSLRMR